MSAIVPQEWRWWHACAIALDGSGGDFWLRQDVSSMTGHCWITPYDEGAGHSHWKTTPIPWLVSMLLPTTICLRSASMSGMARSPVIRATGIISFRFSFPGHLPEPNGLLPPAAIAREDVLPDVFDCPIRVLDGPGGPLVVPPRRWGIIGTA